jgi:GNAT superfamily N-acetyltransferase
MTHYYKHFTDIDKGIRYDLIAELTHKTDSYMREAAIQYDPPCVVAFIGVKPIGWAIAATIRKNKPPVLMVYVARQWRRQGIGTRIVNAITQRIKGDDVRFIGSTRHANKFYSSVLDYTPA